MSGLHDTRQVLEARLARREPRLRELESYVANGTRRDGRGLYRTTRWLTELRDVKQDIKAIRYRLEVGRPAVDSGYLDSSPQRSRHRMWRS